MSPALRCRHCGRPIAVPAANCPWPGCRQRIMVICDACKQYTDDRGEFCQHCGQPLVPAQPVPAETGLGPPTIIVDLAADQARAQLVASGVIAEHITAFLFYGRQQQSVLIPLFGTLSAPERQAAAVLFGALVYLEKRGYATLQRGLGTKPGLCWSEARPWDGQQHSLEAKLALLSRYKDVLAEDEWKQVIAEAMDFRCEVIMLDSEGDRVSSSVVNWGGMKAAQASEEAARQRAMSSWLGMTTDPYSYSLRDASPYPAPAGVIATARQTVLPDHEKAVACRDVYQMLLEFVQADPKRADYMAEEIRRAFTWFERFREQSRSRRSFL